MNAQARESIKTILPTKASLLLSVKYTIIEYQVKLFPFAKAFLGLCLSGLILVSCATGQHNIEISARWSNGLEDSAQLTFDVKEGRKYTIYTHELQEGQDPNASVVLPREYQEHGGGTSLAPLAKNVGEGALQIAGATAFVIISPYVLIYGSPI
jgi:hypothetical protein